MGGNGAKGKKSGGSSNASLTAEAKDYGWTKKDLSQFNRIQGQGAISTSWNSGGKLVVNQNGNRVAIVTPTRDYRGRDVFSVSGRGRIPDRDYTSAARAKNAISKILRRK